MPLNFTLGLFIVRFVESEKVQGYRQPESLIRRGQFAVRLHHATESFFAMFGVHLCGAMQAGKPQLILACNMH